MLELFVKGTLFLLLFGSGSAILAQNTAVEWHWIEKEPSETEKAGILEFIDQAGLSAPERVFTSVVGDACTEVRVESARPTEDNRVFYDLLFLKYRESGQCPSAAMSIEWPQPTEGSDDSLIVSGSAVEERWRISDGTDWSLDIVLDDGVPFEDASAIVRSIHRASWVFVLEVGREVGQTRRLRLTAPYEIALDQTTRMGPYSDPDRPDVAGQRAYWLTTGSSSGVSAIFVLDDAGVELIHHILWNS